MHMNLEVSHECQAELLDLRKQLMEDFSITPEIVRECGTEIAQQCDGPLLRNGLPEPPRSSIERVQSGVAKL